MATEFPPTSPFTVAFASEFKGFMKAHGVTGAQIADTLDRGEGYVSERVNGKRPLDTNDVDALASLVPGWDGAALIAELARRAQDHMTPDAGSNVTRGRFGEHSNDSDLREVASEGWEYNPEVTDADFDGA